ncbi:hypothetical protein H7U18_11315 [Klebsiella pneumoniae]|uniref:Uncharacterized protein n=1 Tax=Klebsiella pneumoniae TaxID=573 RepID=A0A923ELY3_KLEPN|nr:hypothetical protein [Klebsiella pneumoniae]
MPACGDNPVPIGKKWRATTIIQGIAQPVKRAEKRVTSRQLKTGAFFDKIRPYPRSDPYLIITIQNHAFFKRKFFWQRYLVVGRWWMPSEVAGRISRR